MLQRCTPAGKLKPLKIFDFKLMTLSLTFQGLLGPGTKGGTMERGANIGR